MRIEYTPEMFADNFIREVEPKLVSQKGRNSLHAVRQVLLRCHYCKSEFVVTASNAKRIQQQCCSGTCNQALRAAVEGGNEKHPLYKRWLAMNQRCNNPNHPNYINYGGRGITIADDLKEFPDYVAAVTALPNAPTEYHRFVQLDRIDNSKGYTASNLRWTGMSTQAANQRKRKTTANRYRGVGYSATHQKWVTRVKLDGVRYTSATFLTEREALEHVNKIIKMYNLPHPIQEWQE